MDPDLDPDPDVEPFSDSDPDFDPDDDPDPSSLAKTLCTCTHRDDYNIYLSVPFLYGTLYPGIVI